MSSSRDLVRLESDERGDKPDLDALQRNGRSDLRLSLVHLLFGEGAEVMKLLGGWSLAITGGSTTQVTVTSGAAFLAEKLDDGTVEFGVAAGDGTTKSYDFSALADGEYIVYIRFLKSLGASGNRVFWNKAALKEEPRSIPTRYVLGWELQVLASSAPSPGDEYMPFSTITWAAGAGLTVAGIAMTRDLFFEGVENDIPGFVDIPTYLSPWGDGANDRSKERAVYGVKDLYTWVQAVNRQLQDIIGISPITTLLGWYNAPALSLQQIKEKFDDLTSRQLWWDGASAQFESASLHRDIDLGQLYSAVSGAQKATIGFQILRDWKAWIGLTVYCTQIGTDAVLPVVTVVMQWQDPVTRTWTSYKTITVTGSATEAGLKSQGGNFSGIAVTYPFIPWRFLVTITNGSGSASLRLDAIFLEFTTYSLYVGQGEWG